MNAKKNDVTKFYTNKYYYSYYPKNNTMKCDFQTLQIECDGSHNTFPGITIISKRITIYGAKTRKLDTKGSKTISVPWNWRLPKAVIPSWREKWGEGTLVALIKTTQWSSISVPHMPPTNLIP